MHACRRGSPRAAAALLAIALAANAADTPRRTSELAQLGERAFADTTLSASGKLACATCHDPRHAFAPANALDVQLGGPDGRRQGLRATPSLRYLQGTTPFVEHRFDDDDGGSDDADAAPTGGLTWDGRVDTLADQARLPLLDAREMANADEAALAARVRAAAWGPALERAAGPFAAPADAVRALARALEAYQREAPGFHPFSSRYDAWLRREGTLSARELRGLAVFDDPARGNCAGCHPDTPSPRGEPPLFTDYGHVAIGVPRNPRLALNRDAAYADLGLCGPVRTDLARHAEFCGAFITPTLRNVATRASFFHNGAIRSLREAVEFYARRDTDPARFYPRDARGRVRKFDDLPAAYAANVDTRPPFGPSPRPRLAERDVDDLVAFLETLTDGDAAPRTAAATRSSAAATSPASAGAYKPRREQPHDPAH